MNEIKKLRKVYYMKTLDTLWSNPYTTFTGPIIVITLVVFIWFRVGSIISLLERIWRIITGKGEITDQKLSKFNKQMRDIEQFNFVYGLKVRSIEQMHQIIEWIGKHKLSYVDVRSAKKWIDIQSMNVQVPLKSYITWRVVGFAFSAILLVLSSIPLGSKSALLQFKESKLWFYLDQNQAQGLKNDWTLQAQQCDGLEQNKKLVQQISENENKVICESFKDKGLNDYLEKTVHSQRLLSGYIFCMILIFMFVIVMQTQSYHAAKRIKEAI